MGRAAQMTMERVDHDEGVLESGGSAAAMRRCRGSLAARTMALKATSFGSALRAKVAAAGFGEEEGGQP